MENGGSVLGVDVDRSKVRKRGAESRTQHRIGTQYVCCAAALFESSEEPASTMSYHEQAANCTSRERELTRATQDASTEPSTRSRSGVGGHTLETKDSPPSLLFGCMSASAKLRLSFAIAASPSSAASCIYRPLHISITSNEVHDRNLPVRLSTAANRPSTSPPNRHLASPYSSFPSLAFPCCRY
jgi:hypothetical protein